MENRILKNQMGCETELYIIFRDAVRTGASAPAKIGQRMRRRTRPQDLRMSLEAKNCALLAS